MPEIKTKTSAGNETPTETAARIRARLAAAKKDGTTSALSTERRSSPLLEALTERLSSQGKGISSSSSSALQASIAQAISDTQRSGDLTLQRLELERQREVSFARDRAGASYTTALEGRTGYATQTAALRELTETTEKSIRDLDQRYQEAMLTNDANTAAQIAQLRMQKIQFQMQQEENYYRNLISVAGMQQQEEQFFQNQMNENARFAVQMAQSNYQFEKNLGVQYKQLDLQSQELDIARERNQISWAEYRAKQSEINAAKTKTTVAGTVFADMRNEVLNRGVSVDKLDPSAYANWAEVNYAERFPGMQFEDYYAAALGAKEDFSRQGLTPPPPPPGIPTAFQQDLSKLGSKISSIGIFDYFTKPGGTEPKTQTQNPYGGWAPY